MANSFGQAGQNNPPVILSLPFTRDVHGCSKAGAEKALPRASSQAGRVLEMICRHGPVTDRELVALTGYPINVVTARRNALAKQGWIRSAGTRDGAYGVWNTVWVVKDSVG